MAWPGRRNPLARRFFMPNAAPRPCTYPGCRSFASTGARCQQHQVQWRREAGRAHDAKRGSASERGYDSRWQKTRESFLRSHPLCRTCLDKGALMPASVVDHIVPHKGDRSIFWNSSNWQPLCKPCHDRKTATQDGGGWVWRDGGKK